MNILNKLINAANLNSKKIKLNILALIILILFSPLTIASGPYLKDIIYIFTAVLVCQIIPLLIHIKLLWTRSSNLNLGLFLISIFSMILLYSGLMNNYDYIAIILFTSPLIIVLTLHVRHRIKSD